jgi:hypothetical protein
VQGVVIGIDDPEMHARVLDEGEDEPPTVEMCPVALCSRCGHKVPLGVAGAAPFGIGQARRGDVGGVLVAGRPIGHDCPAL